MFTDRIVTTWRSWSPPARWLVLVCLLHTVAVALTWPDMITNTDERCYVQAAAAFAGGRTLGQCVHPETLVFYPCLQSLYPAGTSLVQAVFVIPFGWRGVFVVSFASFLVALWSCFALLRTLKRDTWLTVVLLMFPATLVLSRSAMSDLPNLALATACWALFAAGLERPGWRWWLSGALAGMLLVFREATVLVVAPLFLGAVIRRDPGVHRLIVGGALGATIRPLSALILYGDPLFRHPGYGNFTWTWLLANTPFYLLLTLVVVPGGLAALLAYRGWRWPEVVTGALACTLLHAAYMYGGGETAGPNAIVVGGRYLLPAVPLFVVALGEAVHRLAPPQTEPGPARPWYAKVLGWRAPVLAVASVASVAVHPAMYRWSRTHAQTAQTLCQHIPSGARAVINSNVLQKAMMPQLCTIASVDYALAPPDALQRWSRDARPLYVALAYRTDSAEWSRHTATADAWFHRQFPADSVELVYEAEPGWQQLRIWKVIKAL